MLIDKIIYLSCYRLLVLMWNDIKNIFGKEKKCYVFKDGVD